ncbi:MAG: extensin-like domain-containing protein [Hyphomicrobium sp.]
MPKTPAQISGSRQRGGVARAAVAAALTFGVVSYAALIHNLVPNRFNPLAPPDLAQSNAWFIDARIARLRHDRSGCGRALQPPIIGASAIADSPLQDGCGWKNAVRIAAFAGARMPIDALTCEMAAAMAMWVEHVVQPAALRRFNSRVASIQNFGGYACRNIIGSTLWGGFRSQHATANAIDLSAFTLADGRRISVKSDWRESDAAGQFLREIHTGACRYFRAVLGPNYNEAHRDHFHFDRGFITSCR